MEHNRNQQFLVVPLGLSMENLVSKIQQVVQLVFPLIENLFNKNNNWQNPVEIPDWKIYSKFWKNLLCNFRFLTRFSKVVQPSGSNHPSKPVHTSLTYKLKLVEFPHQNFHFLNRKNHFQKVAKSTYKTRTNHFQNWI